MELKIQSLGNIQEQEEEQEEEEEDKEEEEEEEKHFHVLAVDDSVLDRKILERLLRSSSYKVTCVESGDKALKYLGLLDDLQTPSPSSSSSSSATSSPSSSSPQLSNVEGLKVNLIMTDYCMPGMNGYDLLKRIKGSTWKDVPVVVMSSENVPARVTMCLEGGAEEFLLKPLQLSDLEKLQPHLLKSLNLNQPTPAQTGAPAGKDKAVAVKSGNNVSKRKAIISPKPSEPDDRRPKMKELAVV